MISPIACDRTRSSSETDDRALRTHDIVAALWSDVILHHAACRCCIFVVLAAL